MYGLRTTTCLLFILSLSLGSCGGPFFSPSDADDATALPVRSAPGAVLAQYREYLYVLGGRDESGTVTNEVWMVRTDPDGTPDDSTWRIQAALPGPREGAAAFVTGDHLYVAGGRDADGVPRDTVFFTAIDQSTGRIGIGSPARWITNPRELPQGRYDMASVLHEGRVCLIGGRRDNGTSNDIIHARIYADGQVGHWYSSPVTLHTGRTAAAAVVQNRSGSGDSLVVAGGIGRGGSTDVLDSIEVFGIQAFGALVPLTEEQLPYAVAHPVLVTDGNDLIVGGGDLGGGLAGPWYRRSPTGAWSPVSGLDASLDIRGVGPSSARSAGVLTYVRSEPDGVSPLSTVSLGIAPDYPVVHPGSGIVPTRSALRMNAEPDVTVRYRIALGESDPGLVSPSDPEWDPAITVADDSVLAVRAFHTQGHASQTATYRYRVRSTGFVFHSDRLIVRSTSDAEPQSISPGWFYFETTGARIALALVNLAGSTTPQPKLSVFESDHYTVVPDTIGAGLFQVQPELSEPAIARYPAGRFYILVETSLAGGGDPEEIGIVLYEL